MLRFPGTEHVGHDENVESHDRQHPVIEEEVESKDRILLMTLTITSAVRCRVMVNKLVSQVIC